jgi:mannose-1-phosphate guanylyltransferase / phosphomannomutase
MAGGEGTRLRPLTASQPKPLLPVANRPVLEHVLRLLRRHGVVETVVTVQHLAALVRTHFGDGDDLGMSLSYATEETPLGTAGSVKNAEAVVGDEPFVVISGDALTDVDLTDMLRLHRERGALLTVAMVRVPSPLEFGIVATDDDGRVSRFLEKPTWDQVFSDTVNTGIYVMEPEVLAGLERGRRLDWAGHVLPDLLARGAPVYGYASSRYWADVGSLESYFQVQADVLDRAVEVESLGFEISPGVWVGEGADVDPEARLTGPLVLGDHTKIEAGARIGAYSVIGSNVVVRGGAGVERAVVHDNAYVGNGVSLRGCVIGRSADLMRGARAEQGAVIGDECVVEEEASVSAGVRVYPSKTLEAGATVNTSVIWESRGARSLFGPRGVSGLVNVEITPEHVLRVASAFATTLAKGSTVVICRDASRAARALSRAVTSALTVSAIDVRDLEVLPTPVARFETARSDAAGGVLLRTSPSDPQSLDIVFLDGRGDDLAPAARRRMERVFSRQEFRRAFPGEIAELSVPVRTLEVYVQELLRTVDTAGVDEAGLKVVVDTAGGAAALVLPVLLGRLGVDVLTVDNRLDETRTAESLAYRRRSVDRLGRLVSSSRAAFGVRFDHVGERLVLVDDRGSLIRDDRALLVLLDLVAAERRSGRTVLPAATTTVAEQVCRFHGVSVERVPSSPGALTTSAREPGVIFAGDGLGGFVVPELGPALDGVAAFVRLLGLVARTRLSLSRIDARIPASRVVRAAVPTAWSRKGQVMRAVTEVAAAAPSGTVDTVEGVRVSFPGAEWVLVLPDPTAASTQVWAEAADPAGTAALLERWVGVVESAAAPPAA